MEMFNCTRCGELYYEPDLVRSIAYGIHLVCPNCGTEHDRSKTINEDMLIEMLEGYKLKLGFKLTNAQHGFGYYEYELTRK